MKLWLDDIRHPAEHGCIGWHWARTANEAIAALQTGEVTEASLDHDLCFEHHAEGGDYDYPFSGRSEKTGYAVVLWMEQNNVWPRDGVRVHSMNPAGRMRMEAAIDRHHRGSSYSGRSARERVR